MGLLALLTGLFGCGKSPQNEKHTLSDISAVSIACTHMDRTYGYYFRAHKDQDKWLFDADCFTHDRRVETSFENAALSDEETDALFEILERNDVITYAENYKKPKPSPLFALDETTYSFVLTFSDKNQSVTGDCQTELEEFFYRLAEGHNE